MVVIMTFLSEVVVQQALSWAEHLQEVSV